MAETLLPSAVTSRAMRDVSAWDRLKVNRHWLGLWFMLPTAAILILFLAYPLGLGVWLSFTDARIGRTGAFIGTENYEWLWGDSIFWLSVFNTLLYTGVASVIKFAVGLYLAILLNQSLPFKALLRSVVLIPFIVPTVLSAIAFWWLYDSQFSIISWSLRQVGLIKSNIDFLGDPWNARWSVIFTFSDFQLIYVLTRGGPANATHVFATYAFDIAMGAGQFGQGASIALSMVPPLALIILAMAIYMRPAKS